MNQSRTAESSLPQSAHIPRARLTPHAQLVLLALILILASILRFFDLSALGFWADEFCTLTAADAHGVELTETPINCITPPWPICTRLSAANPFWQIPGVMADENPHPPLYFMLLRLWEDLWGDSESAVRSLNAIFSLVAILLLYFAASDTVGSASALIASLLMAVATPQIQYAQEARNYMPILVFSLAAFIAVTRLRQSASVPAALALMLCLLAGLLTHYYTAGVAVALSLYAMRAPSRRARIYAAVAIAAAALVFLAIWGPLLLRQRTVVHKLLAWLIDDGPGHLQRQLIDLCRLPVRCFVEIVNPDLQVPIAAIGAVTLLWLPVAFINRPQLRPWIAWFTCAVGIVAAADLVQSTTQLHWVRYSLSATPAAYVLLAAAVRGHWRFALPCVAVLLSFLCLPTAYVPTWKIDFRTPVQVIDHLKGPHDGLVICGPNAPIDSILFAAFQHYSTRMPATTAVLTSPPVGQTLDRLRQCQHVWIVWLGNDRSMPGFKAEQQMELPAESLMEGTFETPTTAKLKNQISPTAPFSPP